MSGAAAAAAGPALEAGAGPGSEQQQQREEGAGGDSDLKQFYRWAHTAVPLWSAAARCHRAQRMAAPQRRTRR